MNKERLQSHIEWLCGDHELCNPFLAEDIVELLAEHEKMRVQNEAMKKYLSGQPSNPPHSSKEKKSLQ